MKEIFKEYKENIKYFLNNKRYIAAIIFITILSYGFIFTHFTIGIDDLCFDRYLNKGYWIAADRWGSVIIYKLLGISKFTPIWLESIVILLTICMSIILCSFIRKNLKIKIKDWEFIAFTGILISTPMLYIQLLYQTSSLTNIVSSFGLIIIAIVFYENFYNGKNKAIYCIGATIMPLFISMYEACCQTYIVLVLIMAFICLINGEKNKNIFTWIITSIGVLLLGICFNMLIAKAIKIIFQNNLPRNFANKGIRWTKLNFSQSIKQMSYVIVKILRYIKKYIYLIFLGLAVSTVKAVKKDKLLYIYIYIGIIFANILINLVQLEFLLRINTSWAITIAFMIMYLLIVAERKKYTYVLAVILSLLVLLNQTQRLNNNFYNEYVEYEKIQIKAFNIAEEITRSVENYTKPIIYIYNDYIKNYKLKIEEREIGQGENLIYWSSYAFYEPGVEMTKFINSLGYNFNEKPINIEEYKESIKKYYSLGDKIKEQEIIETDEYIYVKI